MKNLIILLFIILSSTISYGQKKALTEKGEEVILYENGTWKYLDKKITESLDIKTNSKSFKKKKDATFLLKSNNFNVGVWLDPKKWSFNKSKNNPDAEYEFLSKDNSLYGMCITEKMQIPLKSLRGIAIENARAMAPDLIVVKEEYRKVNGIKVLLLHMEGTTRGINFAYYGYYYSNSHGSLQFILYSSKNILDTKISNCDEMLNGIVEIKE